MKIIALSAFARAGKDEAASVLVNEFGFTQVAFADKLREMLYAINPLVSVWRDWDEEPGIVLVQDVIDRYGWGAYKETIYGPEIRRLLQTLGTEGGRQTLWDSIWIDATLRSFDPHDKIVVSDARFTNEFQAVRSYQTAYDIAEVWRIERDGVGPQSDHPSEIEAIGYEYFAHCFQNNGTLEEYHQQIRDYANARGL